MLEANGWDAPEAVELTRWWKTLSKCDIPATAIALNHGLSLAVLFKRAIFIRHCAVHRRPRIPVKRVGEMVRDAWLLSQALQDDLRAAQLLHWHKELENLVAHLQLRINSQREAVEAELRNIHNAKVEMEERLAELESRASQLTQFLEAEGRTHRPIDTEALRSLEEALRRPAVAKPLPITAQDQVRQWIENSVGMKINRKHADETEQETFQGSAQDSHVTSISITLRRPAVQAQESFRLTPFMQTGATNETAGHVQPSAGQLQPSTQHPPYPVSIDDDKSTEYGSVPADYESE